MPGLPKPGRPRAARKGGPRRPSGFFQRSRLVFERSRLARYLLIAAGGIGVLCVLVFSYFYMSYGRLIDERLHGERERAIPRVYARPVELRRGQAMSQQELVARLNDLGYAQRASIDGPGQFAILPDAIALRPRGGDHAGRTIRVAFARATPARSGGAARPARNIQAINIEGVGRDDLVRLDAPLLTALMTSGSREKRRHVPLTAVPKRMQQALLAIEDRSFYSHPGFNPARLVWVKIRSIFGDAGGGYSTVTQQLARMFFLADEFNAELQSGERGRTWGSYWRKGREIIMSIALEQRASKDEILELYLNDVYLGQRGSFAIHGVAEASRIFFGKDVANLSLSEAALIAGVIQSPASRSPFANPERAVERRNLVLRAMATEEYVTDEQAARASREPLQVVARAVDNEAPYFVDLVGEQVATLFPGVTAQPGAVDVYTTLDLNMQRSALDAVRSGLTRVDELLAGRRRKSPQRAQAALMAVDPRTGEVLAMIGGRSYNVSQFNRATTSRRQPGSTFKPFVFLTAFEESIDQARPDWTPASLALDEPATIAFEGQIWEPKNYDQYDGEITWRRAIAMSRNLATIHVGEDIGFNNVAALWRRVGVGTPPQGYPSIALGVFELTPFEVAQAYTLFMNGGSVRPLKAIDRIDAGSRQLLPAPVKLKPVARPETTFLVTNMMRSVIDEGTGAAARALGFAHDAAGKSGTTNDLRDAWFVGFTPELLTVVWVGFDDNTPLGLSGSQAALPIWAEFMRTALAGRSNVEFQAPDGIAWAEIDRDTGKLALPGCPRTITEAFISGTQPGDYCELHRW
jgi:penicillin-binding protein 1B